MPLQHRRHKMRRKNSVTLLISGHTNEREDVYIIVIAYNIGHRGSIATHSTSSYFVLPLV